MPGQLLVTATLTHTNGLVKDNYVNTFAIEKATALTEGDYIEAAHEVAEFYTTMPGENFRALGAYLGSSISRAASGCVVKTYDITDKLLAVPDPETGRPKPPPHGSPKYVAGFTMPAVADAQNVPSQIACALTLRGRTALTELVEDGNERPRQQHSGRLFLGPFNEAAVEYAANGVCRPHPEFRNDAVYAAENLQERLNAIGMALAVWSRKRGDLTVVTSAEMDDSFDVIRSRKSSATLRLKRAFNPVPDIALGA